MSDEAEKRELLVRGPYRLEGGDQHGIGVVLVMTRDDVWIGEACRHIERKPLPRAAGKFRRSKGDRCTLRCSLVGQFVDLLGLQDELEAVPPRQCGDARMRYWTLYHLSLCHLSGGLTIRQAFILTAPCILHAVHLRGVAALHLQPFPVTR